MNILNQNIKETGVLESFVLKVKHVLFGMLERQAALNVQSQEIEKHQKIHKIAINSPSRIDFVEVDEIIFCQASLACTEIITLKDNNLTATKSLIDFERQLSNESFVKISKTHLVNVNQVRSFSKKTSQVTMIDDSILDVSWRRKAGFFSHHSN